jgi:Subtilase family
MRTLAARETPEFDAQGFPVRRGEVVGLDLSRKEIARAELLGFKVTSEQRLAALGMHVTRLRAPPEMTVGEAVKLLRDGKRDANSVYDFDHYYGVNGYEDNTARTKATPPPRGNLWIGMIDTGVSRHTALQGVRVDAHDFAVSTRGQPLPSKHGTAVASILAGQGAGRITSANIFTADGKPYAAADTIAAALNWLVQQQVPVINISLAGPRNALLDLVVARAIAKGHVIVAAAGNGGPGAAPAYPGAIAGVVAATAVDSTNHIYRYANQGNYVFIAAPGVGVPAAAPGGSLAAFSGTSFAAPFVAANMAKCRRTAGTEACIDQLRKSAVDLGAPGKDPVFGWGLIRN